MFKPNKVAIGVGAALAMAYAGVSLAVIPVAPAVVADATLRVDQFTILKGFGGGTSAKDGANFTFCTILTCAGGEELVINQLNATSQISGTMLGQTSFIRDFPVGNSVAFPISHSHVTNGTYQTPAASDGPYTLFTNIPVQPTATYSAAAATAGGNSLDGATGSNNRTQAQTSIHQYGNAAGTAHSDLGLTVTVGFSLGASTDFEFNFNAESYLRAALGQFTNAAQSSTDWTMTISGAGTFVQWNPGAGALPVICIGAVCTEVAAGFSLDNTVSAQSQPGGDEALVINPFDVFELDVSLLAGNYQLTIFHQVNTSGSINEVIPEPGTMALLGLGLLGLGVTARRRTMV